MIRRLNAFADRHPVLSMVAGWLLLIVITLAIVPEDPASVAQALHERAT
jgi:hypothetical protein